VQREPASQISAKSDEPEISFFYLMQHYNKDNAAKYKAQKAAKKTIKGAKRPQAQDVSYTVPGAPSSQNAGQSGVNPGYAVPGTPQQPVAPATKQPGVNPGYAVPGMENPPKTPAAPQNPQPQVRPAVAPQQTPFYQPTPAPAAVPQGQPVSFGETTVLSGGSIGETTVLNGVQTNQARPIIGILIRVKTSERIPLNKPVFRIGKERSYVDYFVGDNTAVSRSHADIITRDGQFFIVDTNSTNHTYVNGKMIQSNNETLLSNGDKIRLANEDFEFRLE
jgi:hypothetical protein